MERETLIEAAYRLIASRENGVFQSELWRELDISNRQGSNIARELEKRNLVVREKQLHDDRWTYRIYVNKKPLEIGFINDVPCISCPYESRCSAMSPEYLLKCHRIENWNLEKFKVYIEERRIS